MLGTILMYKIPRPRWMERPVHWEHWGHKKTGHIGPVHLFTNLSNYLTIVVSAAGATVESTATAVVSTATAVESVVTSVEVEPPQATNDVAITNAKITFFILFVLYLFNCLPIEITGISIGCLKKWDRLYWYPPPVPINVLVKITQPTRYATSLLFSKKSHIENK